jgi:hypothetical protein
MGPNETAQNYKLQAPSVTTKSKASIRSAPAFSCTDGASRSAGKAPQHYAEIQNDAAKSCVVGLPVTWLPEASEGRLSSSDVLQQIPQKRWGRVQLSRYVHLPSY